MFVWNRKPQNQFAMRLKGVDRLNTTPARLRYIYLEKWPKYVSGKSQKSL